MRVRRARARAAARPLRPPPPHDRRRASTTPARARACARSTPTCAARPACAVPPEPPADEGRVRRLILDGAVAAQHADQRQAAIERLEEREAEFRGAARRATEDARRRAACPRPRAAQLADTAGGRASGAVRRDGPPSSQVVHHEVVARARSGSSPAAPVRKVAARPGGRGRGRGAEGGEPVARRSAVQQLPIPRSSSSAGGSAAAPPTRSRAARAAGRGARTAGRSAARARARAVARRLPPPAEQRIRVTLDPVQRARAAPGPTAKVVVRRLPEPTQDAHARGVAARVASPAAQSALAAARGPHRAPEAAARRRARRARSGRTATEALVGATVPAGARWLVVTPGSPNEVRDAGPTRRHPVPRPGATVRRRPRAHRPARGAPLRRAPAPRAPRGLRVPWFRQPRRAARPRRAATTAPSPTTPAPAPCSTSRRRRAPAARSLRGEVQRLAAGSAPGAAVLDWTDLDVAAELPGLTTFRPPAGDRLPYLDDSVDIVVRRRGPRSRRVPAGRDARRDHRGGGSRRHRGARGRRPRRRAPRRRARGCSCGRARPTATTTGCACSPSASPARAPTSARRTPTPTTPPRDGPRRRRPGRADGAPAAGRDRDRRRARARPARHGGRGQGAARRRPARLGRRHGVLRPLRRADRRGRRRRARPVARLRAPRVLGARPRRRECRRCGPRSTGPTGSRAAPSCASGAPTVWARGGSVVYQPTVAAVRVSGTAASRRSRCQSSAWQRVLDLRPRRPERARRRRMALPARPRRRRGLPRMTHRRALVVHTRMPAFDRDSGSQDIDNMVRFLLRAGWQVTFLAREEQGVAEERHARRLRQMGVATHAGFGDVERLLRSNDFDLALIAFWELAAELLPLLRKHSPATRVVINSIDMHFLRLARQSLGRQPSLDDAFGGEATRELNTVQRGRRGDRGVRQGARPPRRLPRRGPGLHPPARRARSQRSPYPLDAPARHVLRRELPPPARTARRSSTCATRCCRCSIPDLLDRHPLTVVGNWLDQVTLDLDPGGAGPPARRVGAVGPALHRAVAPRRRSRCCTAPA